MKELNGVIAAVTQTIQARSLESRRRYLDRMARAAQAGPARGHLSCSNLAHGMAACGQSDKQRLTDDLVPNVGIVTAYNDMLSAHAPYETYPQQIKAAAAALGAEVEEREGWMVVAMVMAMNVECGGFAPRIRSHTARPQRGILLHRVMRGVRRDVPTILFLFVPSRER